MKTEKELTRKAAHSGTLFRMHFVLIHNAIIGDYTTDKVEELAEAFACIMQIEDENIIEKYREGITKAVMSDYTADMLEKVVTDLLKLTEKNIAYKGIDSGDLGQLDSLLDIFSDLASHWMESSDHRVADCGCKVYTMIEAIRNIFKDGKFGETMGLIASAEKYGNIMDCPGKVWAQKN